jgi:hypothetical protein
VDTLLRYLQVRAFSRGVRGYHTAWLVVGVAVWMITRVRNADDVIYRTQLKPGERLVVQTSKPSSSGRDGR